jgi:thiamine monophosphate synthase
LKRYEIPVFNIAGLALRQVRQLLYGGISMRCPYA